jgi:hypothetical protein
VSLKSNVERGPIVSSYAYGALTRRREMAPAGDSGSGGTQPPGVGSYVDAMAALVPAEVLAVHAAILPIATETTTNADGETVTVVTETGTLIVVFVVLIILSMGIFLAGRKREEWEPLDWVRLLIPPLAFVAWTMLQKATAFDALAPDLDAVPRFAYGILAAAILGAVAGYLAKAATDRAPEAPVKPPPPQPPGGPHVG